MVGLESLEEKTKPIPVTFPKRAPIEKVYGFDAPEIRGAVPIIEGLRCPNCGAKEAVLERSWIGGLGDVMTVVCEAGCGENGKNYWERSVK